MTSLHYTKDSILSSYGQPVTELFLITQGSLKASFPGGEYILEKGDTAGICESTYAVHKITYTALEDTTVISYPFSGIDGMESLLTNHPELSRFFGLSLLKQVLELLHNYDMLEYECSALYDGCKQDYAAYQSVSKKNLLFPHSLSQMDILSPFEKETAPESWIASYYGGLHYLFVSGDTEVFTKEPSITTGLIGKASQDMLLLLDAYESMFEYTSTVYSLYLNAEKEDLFHLYTTLYFKNATTPEDTSFLQKVINRMSHQLQNQDCISPELITLRLADFRSKETSQTKLAETTAQMAVQSFGDLVNSLDTILSYSQVEDTVSTKLKSAVLALRTLTDPEGADDKSTALRKEITSLFYTVYEHVFFRSLKDTELSLPVKMFLYFGYMDEVLAGAENAAVLHTLAENLTPTLSPSIYTMYGWLKAIYQGEKEPSRNQFDEDYSDSILSLKAQKKITEAEAKVLLGDHKKKVLYELKNLFPVVNKITHGRISSYCPVFLFSHILKPLTSCYVTAGLINDSLSKIRTLDFSAFYRETLYSNENLTREYIHLECLPDFILAPNVGLRGVMWQEIEGKRRTTPSRMILPIFSLDDVNHLIIRMTGEYRWEMCKRIQGSRWNDVSERSLTSEYFDYIQFYRKNSELSAEAKERIKSGLQKARNSFKEMFVRDYILWILYESGGSPRLNKPNRSILFTYCPFHLQTRQVISGNPLYREVLDQHAIRIKQRLHHLNIIQQKFKNLGLALPEELQREIDYTQK